MKVKWFVEASGDLDQIYDYYLKKNNRVAALLYNKILDEVELLKTHPYIGSIEKLLADCSEGYRSLVVANGKYKVIYFILKETVFIVQVFDCRRNPNNLMKSTLIRKGTV